MSNDNFDRVLDIQEKNILASERIFNKLERITERFELLHVEFKEINDELRTRPCIVETSERGLKTTSMWISIIVGIVTIFGAIIGGILYLK